MSKKRAHVDHLLAHILIAQDLEVVGESCRYTVAGAAVDRGLG
jgi:hypothetical protein